MCAARKGAARANARLSGMNLVRLAAAVMTLLLTASSPCTLCLYGPDNMAFDASGNLYLTDSDHAGHSRLLLLTTKGDLLWQWSGFENKPGERNGPEGLALDARGDILVTDGSSRVIRIRRTQKSAMEALGTAKFSDLGHIAVDRFGNMYVAEGSANRISKFDRAGRLRSVWRVPFPETIAAAPNGNLVVEEWMRRQVAVLSPSGKTLLAFGGAGRRPGRFLNSAGLGVDRAGNIYVADIALHRLQEFSSHGKLLAVISNSPHNRLFGAGPSAIAIDSSGNLYSPDGLSLIKYTRSGKLVARWK